MTPVYFLPAFSKWFPLLTQRLHFRLCCQWELSLVLELWRDWWRRALERLLLLPPWAEIEAEGLLDGDHFSPESCLVRRSQSQHGDSLPTYYGNRLHLFWAIYFEGVWSKERVDLFGLLKPFHGAGGSAAPSRACSFPRLILLIRE